MNANTLNLHSLGQSIWLDNISRGLLTSGTLQRYIADLSVSGLTSNPTIFEHAMGNGTAYDNSIGALAAIDLSVEGIFFELALEDLVVAADLCRPVFDATRGTDGWVSLEVSPLLANDSVGTIRAAALLHSRVARPNLFIKIPGTAAGLEAVEQCIFDGIPINVTLLFSPEQYVAAASAYMRGIERRLEAGLEPRIESVASLFVSRWDMAIRDTVAPPYFNRLGIAMAMRTYRAYRELLVSSRWQKLSARGAHPQRLLWASTGSKDAATRDTFYVEALIAPGTINTVPEKTLLAFADHGRVGPVLPEDGGYAEEVLDELRREGVNDEVLAVRLQRVGVNNFTESWRLLMQRIQNKSLLPRMSTNALVA